jgi:cell division protein FtsB
VTRQGAAGSGPGAKRPSAKRGQRSQTAPPTRRSSDDEPVRSRPQTTITGRAAVLVLAVASVMLAVALPFKIWLGQRGDIASLTAQTRQTESRLAHLSARHRKWQDPAYVEAQARKRLHYALPGKPTHVVFRTPRATSPTAATSAGAPATGPWYSQLWASVDTAGKPAATK